MQLIEQFIASKTGWPSDGEDLVLFGDHFVAVADGVSTTGAAAGHAQSPGRIAAQTVCEAIRDLPPRVDAAQAVADMSARVRAAQHAHGIAMAAAVVVYSAARREVWSVGDCQYLAGPVSHRPVLNVDQLLGGLRALVLEVELAHGATVHALMADDRGRTAIEPFLRMQPLFANSSAESAFAYGVINGTDVPARFVHVHAVPEDVREIVLASDGYPDLRPTLDDSEAALAALLAQDPLRMRPPPSTKGMRPGAVSFDDRAYVRIRV